MATKLTNLAKKGDLNSLKKCINSDFKALESTDATGKTALLRACKYGHAHIVQYLLEQGANISATCGGRTCLHLAVSAGHVPIVKMLLSHGAEALLEMVDSQGRRPIDVATGAQGDTIRKLLEDTHNACRKDESKDGPATPPQQQENVQPKSAAMSMSMDCGKGPWAATVLGLESIREERSSSETQRSSLCAATNQLFVNPANTRRSLQILPMSQGAASAAAPQKFWEAQNTSAGGKRSSVGEYQPMFFDLSQAKPVDDPRNFQSVNLRNVQALESGNRTSFDARRTSFDAPGPRGRTSFDATSARGRTSFDVSNPRGSVRASLDVRSKPDAHSLFDPKTGERVDPNAQAAAQAVSYAVQARASFEASRVSIDQINGGDYGARKRASMDIFGMAGSGSGRVASVGSGKSPVFVRRDWC